MKVPIFHNCVYNHIETKFIVFISESPKRASGEYSGRNLAEYSAETVSVKIMGFGNFAEYSFIAEYSVILSNIR